MITVLSMEVRWHDQVLAIVCNNWNDICESTI